MFGAKKVYRNIFQDKKYVEVYNAEDAEADLGIQREDFVALAYLLGSDYAEGIFGVGIVNALEIIAAFDMKTGPVEGLTAFKKWLHGSSVVTLDYATDSVQLHMDNHAVYHDEKIVITFPISLVVLTNSYVMPNL